MYEVRQRGYESDQSFGVYRDITQAQRAKENVEALFHQWQEDQKLGLLYQYDTQYAEWINFCKKKYGKLFLAYQDIDDFYIVPIKTYKTWEEYFES